MLEMSLVMTGHSMAIGVRRHMTTWGKNAVGTRQND